MRNHRHIRAVTDADTEPPPTTCCYPGCDEPIPLPEKPRPGQPRKYCDNPDHTATTALRLRRKQQKEAALAATRVAPTTHPVTTGTAALATLVDRATTLRDDFAATVADLGEMLAAVCEPASVDHEIATVRRDADIRVAQAESAAAAAEIARQQAEAAAAEARELERLAIDAAEEAIAKADEAEFRAERAMRQAAERITTMAAERDRAREQADAELAAMESELQEIRDARTRAETERDTAVTFTAAARAEATELRAALDTAQRDHHRTIEDLHATHALALAEERKASDQTQREIRQQHTKELAQVRADHREQLAQVRGDLDLARKNLAAVHAANSKEPE
ncbi:hypothetical protein IU501_15060 [Nocardia otitidiscaviarum]|uniref:hypothetical protein n=1 Tax=Nocardia otitidiscaviarum TaxID=1823 RepID=UPI001893ACB0|nr:hypothetical protein [Nocardia otitidiscaviarum]MBF6134315.1 hypothetical protein [Nocardia otitidiscaviarum]